MIIYNLKVYNDSIVELDEFYTTKKKAKNVIKELERKYLKGSFPKEDVEIKPIKVR